MTLIDSHLNRLTLGGYRPSTIRARKQCLRAFAASVAPHQVQDAGRIDVEAFLARPLAPESRRAYRAHLRAFYAWCQDEGFVTNNPTEKLPPVRVPRAQPRPISDADLSLALERANPRMRAWLLLMALAGLRCIEVAALRPADIIERDKGTLLYLRECKGGGTASVPAHPVVLDALARVPIRHDAWWLCNADSVSDNVADYLRGLGIDATAHRLRHYAGTAWYRESGHDLLETANLMRHLSVQTTMRYAALDPDRAAEVVRRVNLTDNAEQPRRSNP